MRSALTAQQVQELDGLAQRHIQGSQGVAPAIYKKGLILAFIRLSEADGTLEQMGRYVMRVGAQMMGEAVKREDAEKARAALKH